MKLMRCRTNLSGPLFLSPGARVRGIEDVESTQISDRRYCEPSTAADPLCYFDDCFYPNAFQWQKGVSTNLGTLPGSQWGAANGISGNGLIVGASQNGENDPLSGLPEFRAVLWNGGQISDLGTLDGGYESAAFAVNNRGQVVGFATNTISDPFSFFPPAQTRAFRSQNGVMEDLGTLVVPTLGLSL